MDYCCSVSWAEYAGAAVTGMQWVSTSNQAFGMASLATQAHGHSILKMAQTQLFASSCNIISFFFCKRLICFWDSRYWIITMWSASCLNKYIFSVGPIWPITASVFSLALKWLWRNSAYLYLEDRKTTQSSLSHVLKLLRCRGFCLVKENWPTHGVALSFYFKLGIKWNEFVQCCVINGNLKCHTLESSSCGMLSLSMLGTTKLIVLNDE